MSESRKRLEKERDTVKTQLDRAIDLLLAAEELSPTVRARAGELQEKLQEVEGQLEALALAERGRRTVVTTWRDAHRQLLDLDLWTMWRRASVDQQRDLLTNVFSGIRATPEKVTFALRGLDFGIELEWQVEGVSPFVEVAGPGRKLKGDMPSFVLVAIASGAGRASAERSKAARSSHLGQKRSHFAGFLSHYGYVVS